MAFVATAFAMPVNAEATHAAHTVDPADAFEPAHVFGASGALDVVMHADHSAAVSTRRSRRASPRSSVRTGAKL